MQTTKPTTNAKMSMARRTAHARKIDDLLGFFNGGQRWVKKAFFALGKESYDEADDSAGGVDYITVEDAGASFNSSHNRELYPVKVDGVLRFNRQPEVACLAGGISLTVHERLIYVDSSNPKSILAKAIIQAANEPWKNWNTGRAKVAGVNWDAYYAWLDANPEPCLFAAIPDFNDDSETNWPKVEQVLNRARELILAGKVVL